MEFILRYTIEYIGNCQVLKCSAKTCSLGNMYIPCHTVSVAVGIHVQVQWGMDSHPECFYRHPPTNVTMLIYKLGEWFSMPVLLSIYNGIDISSVWESMQNLYTEYILSLHMLDGHIWPIMNMYVLDDPNIFEKHINYSTIVSLTSEVCLI